MGSQCKFVKSGIIDSSFFIRVIVTLLNLELVVIFEFDKTEDQKANYYKYKNGARQNHELGIRW